MKTSQGFMTALLTLVALTFLSSSFAQETSPQFVVRIIYFVPNDREPRQNIDIQLVGLIKLAQERFADLMENQGFSRKGRSPSCEGTIQRCVLSESIIRILDSMGGDRRTV